MFADKLVVPRSGFRAPPQFGQQSPFAGSGYTEGAGFMVSVCKFGRIRIG